MPCPPKKQNSNTSISRLEDHTVILTKDDNHSRLGVLVRTSDTFLFVRAIPEDSMVHEWNRENPSQEIVAGDHILEVNGVSGDAHNMMAAFRADVSRFEMKVRPAAKMGQMYLTACDKMRFRTLKAADFELIKLYDRVLPSKTSLPKASVARLPRVKVCGPDEHDCCSICLNDFELGERVSRLPCHHCFCTKCISQWLTENQNQCPQCRATIVCPAEEPDAEGRRHIVQL
jgi:hypothetical protein